MTGVPDREAASWLCRLKLHRFRTYWDNIAPIAGGGPRWVDETCERCGFSRTVRNWRS